jgi:hypothetical protein
MSSPQSVLEKAQALTAEAARLRQGSEAEHEAVRIAQRVAETTKLLQELGKVAAAVRRLQDVTGEPGANLAGLDDGRQAFGRLAASGLPSNQAFTAAKRKIEGVISRVGSELAEAWSRWTAESMARLPLVRITLLDTEDDRASAREYREELHKLARVTVPTRADINDFHSFSESLRETLGQMADQPEPLLALLQRLDERPLLTLAEISDEQITLLRQRGIAHQIELRRRGT